MRTPLRDRRESTLSSGETCGQNSPAGRPEAPSAGSCPWPSTVTCHPRSARLWATAEPARPAPTTKAVPGWVTVGGLELRWRGSQRGSNRSTGVAAEVSATKPTPARACCRAASAGVTASTVPRRQWRARALRLWASLAQGVCSSTASATLCCWRSRFCASPTHSVSSTRPWSKPSRCTPGSRPNSWSANAWAWGCSAAGAWASTCWAVTGCASTAVTCNWALRAGSACQVDQTCKKLSPWPKSVLSKRQLGRPCQASNGEEGDSSAGGKCISMNKSGAIACGAHSQRCW